MTFYSSRSVSGPNSLRSILFLTIISGCCIFIPVVNSYAFHHGPEHQITPLTSPDIIVQSQLAALQKDDMDNVFQYASPSNKAATGPVSRFSKMVRTPAYIDLIQHSRAEIVMTVSTPRDRRWRCLVQVWPKGQPRGNPREYWWALSRCKEEDNNAAVGPNEEKPIDKAQVGCYMVDAVVPNRKLGEIELRPGEM